jgi:hypothetical protein
VTRRNCSYVYNGFLKLNENFSHHIYVIDNFQCKFVKTHVDLLFYLGRDVSFEYGFVDTHAQVDVFKNISHTHTYYACPNKNKIYVNSQRI